MVSPSRSPSETTTIDNQDLVWLKSVKGKLGTTAIKAPDFTIQRIPDKFRKVNEDAYSPRIVSIGPLHWGQPELRAMDEFKWRYMKIILHRVEDAINCLASCGSMVESLNDSVKAHYAEDFKGEVNDNLNQIILLDSLFILELFLRCWDKKIRGDDDPIISNAWLIPFLRHDLSLLENQIPLMVLEELYDIIKPLIIYPRNCCVNLPDSVSRLALHFFHLDINKLVDQNNYFQPRSDCKHLLHLLHKLYITDNVCADVVFELGHFKEYGLVPVDTTVDEKKDKEIWGFSCCATQLLATGIEFKQGDGKKLLEIKFDNGKLRIPSLCIHETTESLLRNLIAFEQCNSQVTHHITSDYDLFSGILREVVPGKFHFGELRDKVNSYHQDWWRWHRINAVCRVRFQEYLRIFMYDYVPNPWRAIQLFAAVAIVLLTALQTYYSIPF